jgi:hypothetical protein
VSQPDIEDESRPCIYEPCPGRMVPELDGDVVTWECGTCHNETYGSRAGGGDTCAAGLPVALQQHEPPAGPVFLGSAISRRPQ